jgi:serine/threonine protein kinase
VLDRKYRLTERIGRGGFGDVWRAVELLPGGGALRDVALKILAPQFDDSTWAEEAKLLASFSHPSLVTIYQAGLLHELGAPFVAMELLLGETLGEKLRRRSRLPWRAALRFVRDVAAALDVIHERGVAHLDLKPANIFVTRQGAVKVLDFGISRTAHGAIPRERVGLASADPALLPTAAVVGESSDPFAATQIASLGGGPSDSGRMIVGTPGFVAPEVLAGNEPTRLADAYALGVTLALLVGGRLPHAVSVEPPDDSDADTFRAYFVELRDATMKGRLRSVADDGAPAGVARLVETLCALAPGERAGASLHALVDEAWSRPHGFVEPLYPGPAPFGAEREGLLFGRDAELVRLLRHLSFESVVAVAGAFGAGKTSFVRAALVPEIAKACLDGRVDHRVVYAALDEEPDAALDAALTTIGAQPFEGEEDDGDLGRLAGLATGDDVGTVLVLDDLERLLSAAEAARPRVVRLVADALAARQIDGVRIVLVVDQDAVDALAAMDPALSSLPAVVRYLAPVPEAAARDIACGAARAAGWTVDGADVLDDAVEHELARGATALPPISIALASWADPRRHTLSAKTTVGEAFHRHASRAFGALADRDREIATEILLQLATSEGAPQARSLEDVTRLTGEEQARVDRVVAALREAYLVVVSRGTIQLAHPALARWQDLVNARLSAMDRLGLRERLAEAADAWEADGRRSDGLDRGGLVGALERRGPAASRGLRPIEREYLALSKRARRRSLAWRSALVAALAIVAVAVVLGKRALDARRLAAEEAERDAVRRAAVTELVSRARGAADPYQRVAYLAQAMRLGAADQALPMELLAAAHELAPARFLATEPVDRPQMPWNSRWVIGLGAAGSFVAIDLEPKETEPEVLEHVDMDLDARRLDLLYRRPVVHTLRVGGAPVVDVVPLAFDTAVLARNAAGEVHLFRLRESGAVVFAAALPMRCRGGLVAAARAPVAACVSAAGVSVWDARRADAVQLDEAAGALALSPDGARLAAWTGADVALLTPFGDPKARTVFRAPSQVRLAAFGPREPLLALALAGRLLVVSPDAPEPPLVDVPALEEPAGIRWDEGGLDLALCRLSGQPVHYFLRKGARAPTDSKPSGRCDRLRPEAPRLVSRFALGEFAAKSTGAHFAKAFELDEGRVLSTSLVLAVTGDDRLDRKLLFVPRDEERRPLDPTGGRSIARMIRHDGVVVVERSRRPEEIDAHELPELVIAEAGSGRRLQGARGHLLSACPDGRIAAWRDAGERFIVFEVRSGAVLGVARRAPGFVVGLSPSCTKLYTQRIDGTIEVSSLAGETLPSPKDVATAAGFAFDVEPSAAFDGGAAGLLVALSSGEILRIAEDDDTVRVLARAAPRATALADGFVPGEAVFADGLGLWRVRRDGKAEKLAASPSGAAWEDVLPVGGGAALVAASVEELSVVDLAAHAVIASAPIRGRTRLVPWGEGGSVLAYAPDVEGIGHGVIVPFGGETVAAVAALASNLRVSPSGVLELKR